MHTKAFTHRRFYTQRLSRPLSKKLSPSRVQDFWCLPHTDAFTHRSFYTRKLFHTEAFPASVPKALPQQSDGFLMFSSAQTLLHTEAFTHKSFYTQKILHTQAFTHRRFYTQTLLHTEAFTHRSFYTQKLLHTNAFTHRSFYTQTLLHTDAFTHRTFTHRRFYTQKLLHTNIPVQIGPEGLGAPFCSYRTASPRCPSYKLAEPSVHRGRFLLQNGSPSWPLVTKWVTDFARLASARIRWLDLPFTEWWGLGVAILALS